ncbi:MAG: hypothetical protein HOQ22_02985 [Nocardioidaceae bacterium]|nr:hypothetical protein [Nocardioidaceae bacterium]NUS49990.1 hypothetical protein [Nocardioidaceae bacterium]
MRLLLTTLAVLAVLTTAGCTDDSNGDTLPTAEDTHPLPTVASPGARLCDFVDRDSVRSVLGTDDFSGDGSVDKDSAGTVSGAQCLVTVAGQDSSALAVRLVYNMGYARKDFDASLKDDTKHQLPADQGLGYSWTEGDAGHTWIGHGNYLLQVDVTGAAKGRDPEQDAVALGQQVLTTLQLPSDWTLRGTPSPSR